MRNYSNVISLTKNSRGVYSIDPIIGCTTGTKDNSRGCYSDCYAARIAKIYGYDFTKSIKRYFENKLHLRLIKSQINKIELPFVRMGTMGDPSEDWQHTIEICKKIQYSNQLSLFNYKPKEIVIITKHWTNLTESQLIDICNLNICINTSVSVLDSKYLFDNSLKQYELLKKYCKSILRVVSCDFNINNSKGLEYYLLQDWLFKNYNVLDTVFRPSKNNQLITDGIINIHKTKFLGNNSIVSKYNKKTYFGKCGTCLEMCGVNMS
jgi:hypothetical protein